MGVLAQSDSDCDLVENTSDKCRTADYIVVEEQRVYKDTTKGIKLPGMQTEVRWLYGSSQERTAWNTPANQLESRANVTSDRFDPEHLQMHWRRPLGS